MVESISCIGYRGFSVEQRLELAIPNGKRGSGLTVLVGPNGGGKSTVMECFSAVARNENSFTSGKRNLDAGDRVSICINYNGHKAELKSLDIKGSETEWIGSQNRPKVYYLPSRRVFNPYFVKSQWDRETFLRNPEQSPFRGNPLNNFTYRLFSAINRMDDFNAILWRILGKQLEWTIDQHDSGQYYLKVIKNEHINHSSDGLGEGVVSLLFIVDAIFDAKIDELIVIDEPELSLHPQLQARLLNEILELTKNVQVVLSTHSPNMLSIKSAINEGVIARVFERNGSSKINCIDETCRSYFKSFSYNLYNPHILGNDARTCFFAEDGFIITEGQEDVMFYPILLGKLGMEETIPFFGFGAGGANCISQIAYILNKLGFQQIGAIFDGDKEKEYSEFISIYEPKGYKAWIIPASDIRDKPKVNKEAKQGILDEEFQINEWVDLMQLKDIMTEVLDFSAGHR